MSVRQGLLAILAEGACYGHQLRAEFDRRTAARSPLNVGQVYSTLDRLERDGLVERGQMDADGLQLWCITAAGSSQVADWLSSPVDRPFLGRDDLAVKLALALSLPGVAAIDIVDRELAAARGRSARDDEADDDTASASAMVMVAASRAFAEADIRWLEDVRGHLIASPHLADGSPLSVDRPRRGRPARSAAP